MAINFYEYSQSFCLTTLLIFNRRKRFFLKEYSCKVAHWSYNFPYTDQKYEASLPLLDNILLFD